MLIHVFNDDDSISILIDSRIVIIRKIDDNYNKIAENLKLRNWDLVIKLIKVSVK